MSSKVRENLEQNRFELPLGNDLIAAAYYRIEGGHVVLVHTEVPQEFSGQGIGSQLASRVLDLLRQTGRKAVLRCPFMVKFFARHPEYADVVVG